MAEYSLLSYGFVLTGKQCRILMYKLQIKESMLGVTRFDYNGRTILIVPDINYHNYFVHIDHFIRIDHGCSLPATIGDHNTMTNFVSNNKKITHMYEFAKDQGIEYEPEWMIFNVGSLQ